MIKHAQWIEDRLAYGSAEIAMRAITSWSISGWPELAQLTVKPLLSSYCTSAAVKRAETNSLSAHDPSQVSACNTVHTRVYLLPTLTLEGAPHGEGMTFVGEFTYLWRASENKRRRLPHRPCIPQSVFLISWIPQIRAHSRNTWSPLFLMLSAYIRWLPLLARIFL